MKKIIFLIIAVCILAIAVPSLTAGLTSLTGEKSPTEPDAAAASAPLTEAYVITLFDTADGGIQSLAFEDYITALVAAEMPPSFDAEAFKAQAVAMRSYILNKLDTYKTDESRNTHPGAMLCNDETHCKAYVPFEETKARWDARYAEDYAAKIKKAVSDTAGEYLTYERKAAKTCFFAVSNGRTESIADVWGVDLPYLVSVDSGFDVRADGYHSRVMYPYDAFVTVLKGVGRTSDFSGNTENITGEISYTDGGGVAELELFGEKYTGAEIKEMFRLRSTCFTLAFEDGKAVFDVKGYGHGVGMSQCGADFMAKRGDDYRGILSHYYPGTVLERLS